MEQPARIVRHGSEHGSTVHLPKPTAWPVVLALGVTLLAAGVVTSPVIGILGVALMLIGCVGWFRDVLPVEQVEHLPVVTETVTVHSRRSRVARLQAGDERVRAAIPIESYPISSGIKGGIAGGIAMIFPALIYGLIAVHSIWYPVNLLGGAGIANWTDTSTANIAAFHWQGLVAASIIHVVTSLLIGLLYGAMLPMLPHRPVLLGGLLAPILWTGLLHATMGVVNPVFDDRIQWGWFLVSQITFGLVAGLVVARQEKIRTGQRIPFAVRLGLESPGLHGDGDGGRH